MINIVFFSGVIARLRAAYLDFHRRFRLMRYFTMTSTPSLCAKYSLPYLDLSVPANLVAWHRIRMYLQQYKREAFRNTEIVLGYIFVVIFVMTVVLIVQLVSRDLQVSALVVVSLYDIAVLAIYLMLAVSRGVQISAQQQAHQELLLESHWSLSLSIETRYKKKRMSQLVSARNLTSSLLMVLRDADTPPRVLGVALTETFQQTIMGVIFSGLATGALQLVGVTA